MNIPEDLRYSKDHEWARIDGDEVTIGITDYAQGELGDIVFVEMPAIGDATEQGKPCGSIEAVKAVSDLYASVSGEVVDINTELETNPGIINQDAFGQGWILKVKIADTAELDSLLSAAEYQKMIG